MTLTWNPAVLAYAGYVGAPEGWMNVVNTLNASAGRLRFTGANAQGAAGKVTVLTVVFDAAKAGRTALDLNVTAMAAAGTFKSLVPVLTVTDGQAQVKRK